MTERKPAGTSWESWIEAQIRVAMQQGAFDNLPGAGKPIPNLGQESDPLWWVKQFAKREQISILPPSLALQRKVETELAAIEKASRRSDRASSDRGAQRRDRQAQRDRGGGAADAPQHAGRRSGRGALAAISPSQSSLALRPLGLPEATKREGSCGSIGAAARRWCPVYELP